MLRAMVAAHGRKPRQEGRGRPTGELALIELIRARAATPAAGRGSQLQLGIGDDCAILRQRPGEDLVVTTDFSLEGRHFRRDWHSPESIGHRTLARGLSDIAAMGGRPVAAFLSLALPKSFARRSQWVERFLDGLLALASRCNVPLAGGDTSEAPTDHVLADIVVLGVVPKGKALRRDGARAGDRLFVTGALGGADAQLQELLTQTPSRVKAKEPSSGSAQPHFFPEPRLMVGQLLVREDKATAALDLSDGLSTDLRHLCEASGVCAEIHASSLPLHPLLEGRDPNEALKAALHGGEDYELLFTARPRTRIPARLAGTPIREIGRILPTGRGRPRVTLIDAAGRRKPLAPAGWEHLK